MSEFEPINATVVKPQDPNPETVETVVPEGLTTGFVPSNYAGYFATARKDFAAFFAKVQEIPHANKEAILKLCAEIETHF
jgi:hypothetical protein